MSSLPTNATVVAKKAVTNCKRLDILVKTLRSDLPKGTVALVLVTGQDWTGRGAVPLHSGSVCLSILTRFFSPQSVALV